MLIRLLALLLCLQCFLMPSSKAASSADTVSTPQDSLSDREIATIIFKRARAARIPTPPGKGPLNCNIGCDIIDLVGIDEAKETYTLDFYSWIDWQDSRLAFTPDEFGVDYINIQPSFAWDEDKLWNPNMEFMNLVDTKIVEQSLRIDSSGHCSYTIRQIATFKFEDVDKAFKRFPLDKQNLSIMIESFRWDATKVKFDIEGGERTYSRAELAEQANLDTSEWKVQSKETKVLEKQYGGDPAPFSVAQVVLSVKREAGFYLWKICLPIFALVLIALVVPWVPHDEMESRVVLSITTLVAVTTYSIIINGDLPKLPYLTVIDSWMLWSFIVIVFVTMGNVLVAQTAHRKKTVHEHFDSACRWAVPLVFLAGVVIIWMAGA